MRQRVDKIKNESMISIAVVMEKSGVNFGTSGVRGRVVDLSDEVCWVYAAGFIKYLQETRQLQPSAALGIAGDYRTSTDRMMGVLSQAIVDQGYQPINLGKIPSPALALYGLKQGIPTMMVTGSHIPEDRNGIKFNTATGEILKLDEQGIRAQLITIPTGKFTPEGALVQEPTMPALDGTAQAEYVKRYLNFFPQNALSDLSIGLYEHSSVSRECLYEILTGLGAKVMRLGRSDAFISVDTEAIRPEDIALAAQWSVEHHFDCIISTDGDGDRPLLSDEKGVWLRGDVAGILCAMYLEADAVITPVNGNSALELSGLFSHTQRTQIGSPFVIAGMMEAERDYNRVIGYEANGGVLVGSEITKGGRKLAALPTRDAAIVPLAILMLAKERGVTISALLKTLPKRYTVSNRLKNFPTDLSQAILSPLLDLPLGEALKAGEKLVGELAGCPVALNSTDGLRLTFESGDIIHFRPSGNAPELRCYTESASETRAVALNAACIQLMETWRLV
jgi:phosphomannomutase